MITAPTDWPYPGARWWKVDFHTHTPASKDWDKINGGIHQPSPEDWLLEYMRASVDCVAITDHNSGAWIDKLKGTYEELKANPPLGFREMHLFPGVELSVNGGFHLLAIFDKDAATSDIDMLLGKVEYLGTKGDSDAVTRKSPVEVIEAIVSAGALPIPAHADKEKGLLRLEGEGSARSVLDPNTIRQVFKGDRVLGMEVVDPTATKPHIYLESGCTWTEVLGSDCESLQRGTLPGSRFTWIKMATPSLEGLRLALLDGPGFSVRRSDDPEPLDPFIVPVILVKSIQISEARYMGRGEVGQLVFNPWFNAIVGGRGTGKSTVVHALRLAYRRESELDKLPEENDTRTTFERFVREPQNRNDEYGALDYRSSRKMEILVTLVREGVDHRLRWRQDGSGTPIEEQVNGNWQPEESQSVSRERFPVRIFGQGQIASLAGESQGALLSVIDDAAGTGSTKKAADEAEQRFYSLQAQIRELEARLKGRDDIQVALNDVRRKLASFEGKEHAEILKAYQCRSRQEREIERQIDQALQFAVWLHTEAEGATPEEIPAGMFAVGDNADGEALAAIGRLHDAFAEAVAALREAGEGLETKARQERDRLAAGAWHEALARAIREYQGLVEELGALGVADPSEYGKLVQERQRLESEIARFESIERDRVKLVSEAAAQRQRVRETRQALSEVRRQFLEKALARNPYVRIELYPYGRDPRVIERELRKVLGVMDERFGEDILEFQDDAPKKGIVASLIADLATDPQSAATAIEQRLDKLAERFVKAFEGLGDFGGHLNNYIQRECTRQPELLDRLVVWSPEDSLKVEYSPRGDGTEFRSIGQASKGQRAAAMLAFLLAHGQEPLVIDQPEDDLDNHLIYDLVVRQIRANKLRRQIILVTHNPNIVVNGDAEMVHALDFAHGQCRVVQAGSLQEQAMREEVCRVMEGGREAFERRYRRLGREN